MVTIIQSASVKVMQSYDYCHFEASMSLANDNGISKEEIDNARKECQRLTDKAVSQFKISKKAAQRDLSQDRNSFLGEIERIKRKAEGDRTINELAKLKAYEDNTWQKQFEDRHYDYDDDDDRW